MLMTAVCCRLQWGKVHIEHKCRDKHMLALNIQKLQAFVCWHVTPVCVNSFYHLARVEGGKFFLSVSESSAQASLCSLLENSTWARDKYKLGEKHALKSSLGEWHLPETRRSIQWNVWAEALTTTCLGSGFALVPNSTLPLPAKTCELKQVRKPMAWSAGVVSTLCCRPTAAVWRKLQILLLLKMIHWEMVLHLLRVPINSVVQVRHHCWDL